MLAGIYNCTSEQRLRERQASLVLEYVHPFKKACRESGVLGQVVCFTVDHFKSFKKNRLCLIYELNNLLLVSPSMHGHVGPR